MALKAGYKGFKKLISPLKLFRPGELGIDQDALVEDLDPVFFPRSEQAVLGAKNWLETSLARIKALNGSGTWNDNVYTFRNTTFTVNNDLSITVNNLATPAAPPYFFLQIYPANTHTSFDGKNLILNGCPEGGGSSKYRLRFDKYDGTNDAFDYGAGVNLTPETVNVEKSVYIQVYSQITNKVFKPMLSFDGGEYAPYAMTNKVLTDAISNISSGWDYSSNTVIDTGKKWIDGKPIYCYVKTFDTPVEVSYNSWTGILENVNTVIGKNVLNVLSLQGIGSGTYGGCTPYLAYYDDTNDKINALSTRNAVNTSISKAVLMFTADDSSTPEAVSTTRSTKKSTKKTASADINE